MNNFRIENILIDSLKKRNINLTFRIATRVLYEFITFLAVYMKDSKVNSIDLEKYRIESLEGYDLFKITTLDKCFLLEDCYNELKHLKGSIHKRLRKVMNNFINDMINSQDEMEEKEMERIEVLNSTKGNTSSNQPATLAMINEKLKEILSLDEKNCKLEIKNLINNLSKQG